MSRVSNIRIGKTGVRIAIGPVSTSCKCTGITFDVRRGYHIVFCTFVGIGIHTIPLIWLDVSNLQTRGILHVYVWVKNCSSANRYWESLSEDIGNCHDSQGAGQYTLLHGLYV